MDFALSIAGTTIDDVAILNEEQLYKFDSVQSPAAHGGTALGSWRGRGTVNMTGRVVKADVQALRDYQVALDVLFSSGLPVKIIKLDDARYKWSKVERFRWRAEAEATPGRSAVFEVAASIVEPFWYAAGAGETVSYSAAASPTDQVVANDGAMPTPPRFTITPSLVAMNDFRLTNTTTGRTQHYAGTIQAGEDLIIDTKQETVRANGIINDLKNHTGFMWLLQPGNNTVRYEGDVTVDIVIEYFERF